MIFAAKYRKVTKYLIGELLFHQSFIVFILIKDSTKTTRQLKDRYTKPIWKQGFLHKWILYF
jgi:hypothetical protein